MVCESSVRRKGWSKRDPWSSSGLPMPWAAAPWGREARQPPAPELGTSCKPTCCCCHCPCPGAACSPSIPPHLDFSQQGGGCQSWVCSQVHSSQAHSVSPCCGLHSPFMPLCLFFLSIIDTHACAPSLCTPLSAFIPSSNLCREETSPYPCPKQLRYRA